MRYSDSEASAAARYHAALPNKDYSDESKSFYTDFSAASLAKTPSAANGILTQQQITLTKCMAASFRFRSRRVANLFWRWKFTSQNAMVGGGRSTIQGATQNTQMDADSEVADLIQKYKLFGGGQTDENSPANEVAGDGSGTELVTEENIDDGDEAVISK